MRTRRRGLTCHRSVRRGRGVPRAEAIRLVPDAPPPAVFRAVLAGPEFPLALAVPVALVPVLRVLAVPVASAAVLVAPAALVRVLRVLAGLTASAVRVAVPQVLAARAVMAG